MSKELLPDIQSSADERGIALWQVGIKEFELPLTLKLDNHRIQPSVGRIRASIGLHKDIRGAHMSRFIEVTAKWFAENPLGFDLKPVLQLLRDSNNSDSAAISILFTYFRMVASPVSEQLAPLAYHCELCGELDQEKYCTKLKIEIPVSNLCPCSKAIANYGAHNQRAVIRAEITFDPKAKLSTFSLADLITNLEKSASAPVYPLLKRKDEKHITELQYENAKFVEDVVRDATLILRTFSEIQGFALEVEALESIHKHNAWAAHREQR